MAWKWGVVVALIAVVVVQGFVVWTSVQRGPQVVPSADEWKGLKR
jgi:hypothetical protein